MRVGLTGQEPWHVGSLFPHSGLVHKSETRSFTLLKGGIAARAGVFRTGRRGKRHFTPHHPAQHEWEPLKFARRIHSNHGTRVRTEPIIPSGNSVRPRS